MATIPSNAHGARLLNNLPEYGNGYGIPLVSELTLWISQAIAGPGEIIYAARFHVNQTNGIRLYSPEITYNGVGEVSYNFGIIQKNWITPSESIGPYVSVGWEVRTNKSSGWYQGYEYFYHGWYGLGVSILEYSLPLINLYNAARSLTVPTIVNFTVDCLVSPLSVNSTLRNLLKYKVQYFNGSWVDASALVAAPGVTLNSIINHSLPYLESQSYQTRVVIQDKFNTLYAYDVLPTTLVPLSIGKFGIGVGKVIEHVDAALDIEGKVYRNNLLQPKIFMKKPSDPNPDGMEEGDLLLIFNSVLTFISSNFPQDFGTGYVWGQVGVWPTDFLYWTSTSSITNSIIESIESSSFKGDSYPHLMFNNNTAWNDNVMFPVQSAPITMILKFKGKVQFNSFTLWGWAQGHEVKNSPKSFAFFGSNDGHTWIPLFDTTTFADTYNSSASAAMNNSGMYFKYLKMVWRTNQDNNSGNTALATLISFRELTFNASGERYV